MDDENNTMEKAFHGQQWPTGFNGPLQWLIHPDTLIILTRTEEHNCALMPWKDPSGLTKKEKKQSNRQIA